MYNFCMKHHIILLMAGRSQRMTTLKQFMLIHNQPIYSYPLTEAKKSSFHPVITCVVPKNFDMTQENAEKYIHGGETRLHSIFNALSSNNIEINDHVIIHDVARAGVLSEDFDEIFALIHENKIVAPIIEINDACVNEEGQPIQERMFRVLTPIGFVLTDHLMAQLDKYKATSLPFITILTNCGYHLSGIKGHQRLSKLTTEDDVDYMKWILRK
jgi:2-C-methyl-D-erythritol 4-phosphate cytidylyltransferase / 2-C-methyl-D-erythritol 2,4-cyclodiphosphate synthase